MSQELAKAPEAITPVELALVTGDLAKLTSEQRVQHYRNACTSLGLNPLTRPFEYVTLNGKLVFYATKNCAEQLRHNHGISITKVEREVLDNVLTVTVYARNAAGREDSDMGAVDVSGLKGQPLANTFMKALTKAKRRVTLSICGLGMLDESEVESIPGATQGLEKARNVQALLDHPKPCEVVPHFEDDGDPGLRTIKIGKQFVGMKFQDVDLNQLQKFVDWARTQTNPSHSLKEFLSDAMAYLETL